MDLAQTSPITLSSLFSSRDEAGRGWRRSLTVSVALHGLVLGMVAQQHLQSATLPDLPLQVILSRPAAPPVATLPDEPPPPERTAQRNAVPDVIRASRTAPVMPSVPERPVPVIEESAPPLPVAAVAPDPSPVPAPQAIIPKVPDATLLAGFNRALSQAVERQKRYPRIALLRHWQGTAVLKLNIGSDGRLQDYRLTSSSGYDALDQQALEMLRDALPLPELPAQLAGLDLSIDIPVTFRIAD